MKFTTQSRCAGRQIHPALNLFFLLFFALIPGRTEAQDLECSDVVLTFCPVLSESSPLGCEAPGCFRFHYDIFFQPNPSNDTFDFEPDHFSIIAELQSDGPYTAFNIQETEDCSPSAIIDSATVESQQVTIFYGGSATFEIEGTPYYLATLVVDAYPGEEINLLLSGGFGIGTEDCDFITSICQGGDTDITFTRPDECDSLTFEFGNEVNSSSTGGAITVPVNADKDYTGTPGTHDYEDLDVLVTVESDQPMHAPQVIGSALPASAVEVTGADPGQSFTLYAKASDVDLTDGITKLFDISMAGPVMQSMITDITLKLVNARAEEDGEDCCSPVLGDSLGVQWDYDGVLECDSFTVNVELDDSYSSSCQVKVDINLEHETYTQFRLHQLQFAFDFNFTGGVTIDTVILDNWDCISSTLLTSPCDTCLTWTSGGSVNYCLNLDPLGNDNLLVTSGYTGLSIIFNTPDGCVGDITFTEAIVKLISKTEGCVPTINMEATTFPACSPVIAGYIFKEDTSAFVMSDSIFIREINGGLNPCEYEFFSECPAPFSQCVCRAGNGYEVEPKNDIDHRCGVTTFDLVEISRHILGVKTLDSDHKIVAADANGSNSVTTFDIVELRKLILFIYEEELPNSTSWRFVQADYDFNLADLAVSWPPFPEKDTVTAPDTAYFIGIKVGDVNLSCDNTCDGTLGFNGNVQQRGKAGFVLTVPEGGARQGEVFTVNVQSATGGLVAYQAGLLFDPSMMQLIGPSKGTLEGYMADNFGLTEADLGRIRTLWFSQDGETQLIGEGDELFNLTFRAQRDIPDISGVLALDDGVLEGLAYDADGTEFTLSMASEQVTGLSENLDRTITEVAVMPNPFTSALTFDITAREAVQSASIWVFDASGRRLALKEAPLAKGSNTVMLEDSSGLPSGVLT